MHLFPDCSKWAFIVVDLSGNSMKLMLHNYDRILHILMPQNACSCTDTVFTTCVPVADGKRIMFLASIMKNYQLPTYNYVWLYCKMNEYCISNIWKCLLNFELPIIIWFQSNFSFSTSFSFLLYIYVSKIIRLPSPVRLQPSHNSCSS